MTKLLLAVHTIANGRTKLIWAFALAALLATAIGVASPQFTLAQSERTLNLGSLTVTDENGTAIDLGTFDPAVLTYSGDVASTVERVTVTARPETDSGVYVNLTPGDYGSDDNLWEVEGRNVRLNHGRNLILIGVYSFRVDEPLRVYTVEINRAGNATPGAENYISISSLSTAREGSTVPFLLTRSGDVSAALKVSVDFWSTDDTGFIYVVPHIDPVTTLKRVDVEFPAGSASAIVRHATTDDSLYTGGFHLGVTLIEGTGYGVPPFDGSGRFASTLVWDNDSNKPTLESLSLTDKNGASVAIGEFDPDLTSYSGSVGSEVTYVTVSQSTTWESRFAPRVLPPDSEPNVDGHQVALQHGANLVSVILMAPFHDDAVTSGTYDVIVTRAGSPSGTPTPIVSVYGLSGAKEGYTMPFILARSGDTSQGLTVTVNVSETGGDAVPQASEGSSEVVFPAGSASARIEVPTVADQDWEEHSTVTVAVVAGTGYELSSQSGSASSTVKDNDVPAVTAAFTVDSSQPQEGEVVTVTVTATTDGPKQPHSYVGSLDFSAELGSAQQEDLHIPFDSNYRDFPAGHRVTGSRSYGGSDPNSASFFVNQPAMQPVESDGTITHYQYQFSVPILIVDDERAEADETFDTSVEWDSYSRGRTLTMDQGITSRTVTIQEHDDTPATPSPISYITVVIADSGTAGSTYTVSWHDTGECVGSRKYEVYLNSLRSSGWTMHSKLGETANTNTQLTVSKDNFPLSGQRNLRVYCGDMGRTVGEVPLPSATVNSVERPVPGTYSSQPALTSLTVSPGTLGPAFSNYGFLYSVLDVPDSSSQITLNAAARSGYTISWDPSEDADANTDGHQVDLAEGYDSIFVSVDHDLGINSFTYEVIVKGAGPIALQQQENSPATGSPTVSGTVQVGQTLAASTTGIADSDGLTNAAYSYQWVANDGSSDSNIADATANAYTPVVGDAGKTIKVKVAFADDGGNEETLTSAATTEVTATVPGAPGNLSVSVNDTGKLDVSWDAPDSNGGSDVSGYRVQWKEAADSWDPPSEVSEATVTGTSHTATGLTDGVEYTFRVFAVNTVGDSTASEDESGTPRETSAPTVSSGTVDGATLTLTFSEGLAETPLPAVATFTVNVGGNQRGVNTVAISGSTVTLTLASAVTSTDDVSVGYTVPSDAAAARLKDLSDNPAESFTGQAVTNSTAAAQTPLTASIHDEPSSHDGQEEFTFELRFSENLEGFSYKTLRVNAFTVTGGKVEGVRRLTPPSNTKWQIKILPTSNGDVTIVLPITEDCTADGAVCTGDRKLSNRLEIIVSGPTSQQTSQQRQENTSATGSPTIGGTVQVRQTLAASTTGIADTDGLTNAAYSYQWIANDGSSDSNIADATASAYTLVVGDAGKTIKVKVTFTDDGGNEETLTSAPTAAVAATVPGAPGSLSVSVNDTGKLDVSWDAPDSNGGSSVTGYRVQWKEAADSWDTPADVSETTVTGTNHTGTGLTDGVEYTFRVFAVNSAGDSAASEDESGTPRETSAPTVSSGTVDGATLTLTFSEGLAETPLPAVATFTVNVGGNQRGVNTVAISGSTVTLTLASAVTSTDDVSVGYTVPSDAAAARLKDLSDNPAESFTGQAVTNSTAAAQTPLTASIHDEPSSHDGQEEFTFELRFSENLEGFSYKTLRVNAFTVTGGKVEGVRRLTPPSNTKWQIKILPTSNGDVTIVLPITEDCTADGAVCTGDRKLSNRLEIIVSGPTSQQTSQQRQENTSATGSPTIGGTVQVRQTLAASTTGIADTDGLTNAAYSYQWIANDGSSDSNIADATASAYTLVVGDAGKTIKVKVTFTDDGGNEETLTSAPTAAVAATVPGAPGSLSVSVNDTGKLDVSWSVPGSNGGSSVTGYRVQWKEAADSWDTPADVSETTVTGTNHTGTGLTDGVEYTFRVFAVNSAGDSAASEDESGTPRETSAPTVSSGTVDGATLTLTFSEGLAETPLPAVATFTVNVGGNQRGVNTVAISGSTVTLTLASAVTSTDDVSVGYTVPSDAAAARLRDLSDNPAESFTGQAVTNSTAAAQTPLTASIHDEPSSHDGQKEFTFELRFSENLEGFSYKTLRDNAFTVTGGRVEGARRLDPPSNIEWQIKIRPTSNGDVTIVLSITEDCTADGAVCTGDRKLSNRLEIIVSGPNG